MGAPHSGDRRQRDESLHPWGDTECLKSISFGVPEEALAKLAESNTAAQRVELENGTITVTLHLAAAA
jgi:hypothetical protein